MSRIATGLLLALLAATPAAAQWITVTVDIDGGRWQISSTATITLYNRWGNIAGDGYIGGTHALYSTNRSLFEYPRNLGQISTTQTNTPTVGSTLPPGCNYATINGQSFDSDYPVASQYLRTGSICWEDEPASDPPPGGDGDDNTSDGDGNGCGGGTCSPLVLDLNGDGVHTTGESSTVAFDLDADGATERVGWTHPQTEEAFLWIDLLPNHRVDDGRELFGVGTFLPDGTRARDGFAALAVYDGAAAGGNADGVISVADAVWGRLRLWVDRNHDGVSQPQEITPIHAHQVTRLLLRIVRVPDPVEAGNVHAIRGLYESHNANVSQLRAMNDVFFRRYD